MNDNSKIKCNVCPRGCVFKSNGEFGWCGARVREKNEVISATYGIISGGGHMDPIEKKPLYHFMPGTMIYSIGSWGCSFSCLHCQNYHIAQKYSHLQKDWLKEGIKRISPEEIVEDAIKHHSKSIAITYNEPIIWYEYVIDLAKAAHNRDLKIVLVTNGYATEETAKELASITDAANIDLKAFTEDFYKRICKGKLQPVLDTIEIFFKQNVHIELTTLLIPTLNDSSNEISQMMNWVVEHIGTNVPHHFSRFYPTNKLTDIQGTSIKSLQNAWDIARKKGLKYVYLGNVNTEYGNQTVCPNCGNILIKRSGFITELVGLDNQKNICKQCDMIIPYMILD